jgi:glycosyltransferase involved in cell wall biosynthesis
LRVSIVTPSYNQAAFLEQTIQSVLMQDYPDLEYFVIDGGSQDGSVDIIRRYADRLAGWVSEKDSGQAEAINKGFARATGDVIAWINSDDYYLPGAVASAVKFLQEYPDCGMVYGDVVSVDEAGEPINVMTFDEWGLEDLMQFEIIGQPGVFMRRSVLEQAGYLDPSYHMMLDHHLWLRMAQFAPIHYVSERWAAARFHAAAKNLAHGPKFGQEGYRLVQWMSEQSALAMRYRRLRRRIWAGACRQDAFYLLDAGRPLDALKAYWSGLWAYPPGILRHWRRMLFAAASLVVNVDRLRAGYLEQRKKKLPGRLGPK